MKHLFYSGGTGFMSVLTILFIITIAWIIFHYARSINATDFKLEQLLRKVEYGKQIGIFAMVVGFTGQLVGLYAMFSVIAEVETVKAHLVFNGVKQTLICPIYGILIFLFTMILSFVATTLIEKRLKLT